MTSRTRWSAGATNSSRNETTPSSVCSGVEHVGVVDGLDAFARLAAQVADRLVDAHLRPHAREARAHQAAGLVLGVGEQGRDFLAGSARRAAPGVRLAPPRGPPASRSAASSGGSTRIHRRRSPAGSARRSSAWSGGLNRLKNASASAGGSVANARTRSAEPSTAHSSFTADSGRSWTTDMRAPSFTGAAASGVRSALARRGIGLDLAVEPPGAEE